MSGSGPAAELLAMKSKDDAAAAAGSAASVDGDADDVIKSKDPAEAADCGLAMDPVPNEVALPSALLVAASWSYILDPVPALS